MNKCPIEAIKIIKLSLFGSMDFYDGLYKWNLSVWHVENVIELGATYTMVCWTNNKF